MKERTPLREVPQGFETGLSQFFLAPLCGKGIFALGQA